MKTHILSFAGRPLQGTRKSCQKSTTYEKYHNSSLFLCVFWVARGGVQWAVVPHLWRRRIVLSNEKNLPEGVRKS